MLVQTQERSILLLEMLNPTLSEVHARVCEGAFFRVGQHDRKVCHEGVGVGWGCSDVTRPGAAVSRERLSSPFTCASGMGQLVSHVCGKLLDASSVRMWVFLCRCSFPPMPALPPLPMFAMDLLSSTGHTISWKLLDELFAVL